MLAVVLWSTMSLNLVAAPPMEETWEGTLWVESLSAKPKKKKVRRGGDVTPITLRLTRKKGQVTGVWIEEDRRFEIKGVMKRGEFNFQTTRLLEGKGLNNEVVNSTRIAGEFDDNTMQGWLYGEGTKRIRGGEFELKKVDPSKSREESKQTKN